MEVIILNFRYSGTVCSDLQMIKGFIEDTLVKIEEIIDSSDTMFDIKLILNELVINGALHGNNNVKSKCVKLLLEINNNKLRIEVEDEGAGIDYDFNSYDSSKLYCNGRGLVIVSKLSDEFYIKDNKVIAIKNLN